jgi:hypothetical protein
MSVDTSHANVSVPTLLNSIQLAISYQVKDYLGLPSLGIVAVGPVRNPADFPFCSIVPVETRVLEVTNRGVQYATRVLIEAHANKKDSRSAMRQSLGLIENIKSLFEVHNVAYKVPDSWDSKFGVDEKFLDLDMKEPYQWLGDFNNLDEVAKWIPQGTQTHYYSHTLIEHEGKSAMKISNLPNGDYNGCWVTRKVELPPIEEGKYYGFRLRYVRFGGGLSSTTTKVIFGAVRNIDDGVIGVGINNNDWFNDLLLDHNAGEVGGDWVNLKSTAALPIQTGGRGYELSGGVITITITGGGGTGAAATAAVLVGDDGLGVVNKITSITVTNPGSGYTEAPVVAIRESNLGKGATVKATIDEDLGTVTSIDLTIEFWFTMGVKSSLIVNPGVAVTDISIYEITTTNLLHTGYPSNPQELVEDTQFVSMTSSSPAEPYKNGFLHSTGAEFDFIYTKPHSSLLKDPNTSYELVSVDSKTIVDIYTSILKNAKTAGQLYIKDAVIKDFVLKPQPKYPVVFVGLNAEERTNKFAGADLIEYQLVFYIINKDGNRRRESSDAAFLKHIELVEKIQDILIHNLDAKGQGLNGELKGTLFGQSQTAEGLLFTSSISLSVQIFDIHKFQDAAGPYTQAESTPPVTVTLVSPNGFEQWKLGTTHNISWTHVSVGLLVNIKLYRVSTDTYTTIISGAANTGGYSWSIPDNPVVGLVAGNDYKIYIEDASNSSIHDFSDSTFSLLSEVFETKWETEGPTVAQRTITLPLYGQTHHLNFTVDWGDGTSIVTVNHHNDPDRIHTYINEGLYTVKMKGLMSGFKFNAGFGLTSNDHLKIKEITNWGDFQISVDDAFKGCANLVITAPDGPDLSLLTGYNLGLEHCFAGCTLLESIGLPSSWDVSNVTTFKYMFHDCPIFNQDITMWDMSSAVQLQAMFMNATIFNQDISVWNMPNLTGLPSTFQNAIAFNQNLNSWDWSNVTDLWGAFHSALAFQNGTEGAGYLGGNPPTWDLGENEWFVEMFQSSNFNQDLSGCTGIGDGRLFYDTGTATQSGTIVTGFGTNWVGGTGVFSLLHTVFIFADGTRAGYVTAVNNSTEIEVSISQTVATSQAYEMRKGVSYRQMFAYDTEFDRDIGHFDVTRVQPSAQSGGNYRMQNMFQGALVGLSTDNYNETLDEWVSQSPVSTDININFGTSTADTGGGGIPDGEAARDILTDPAGLSWVIQDGDGTWPP